MKQTVKIVYIVDNAAAGDATKRLLAQIGFRDVEIMKSGKCRTQLNARPVLPDVILIHLNLQDITGIDRSDRDPTASHDAFNDLKTLTTKYPQSKYAADARKRMHQIKSRLAKYEIAVANFYLKRDAFASAANRGRYIVEYFAPAAEVEEALEIMIKSYDAMGLTDLKSNAMQVLAANYPNNSMVR